MTGKSSAMRSVALGTGTCFLMAILEGYDIQAFGIAAPKLIVALGLNPSQQGLAASIAMVGLVLGAFFGGRISDSVGRKPVLLVSAAIFGFCSIWTGLSTNFEALLLARFITGLGFGGAFPVLIALAAEISSPARRSVTTGILFSGMPTGGALVSLFARIGGEQMDWRTVFFVGGAIPLIVLPLLWKFLPETRPARDANAEIKLFPVLFRDGRAFATVSLTIACFLAVVVIYLFLNWLPTLVVAKGHLPGDGASAAFVFNTAAVFGSIILGMAVDLLGVQLRWSLPILRCWLRLFCSGWLRQFPPSCCFLALSDCSQSAYRSFSTASFHPTIPPTCAPLRAGRSSVSEGWERLRDPCSPASCGSKAGAPIMS